jgi:lactate permease
MVSPLSPLLTWLLAAAPIVVVLFLMIVFRWGGAKAGPVGWFTALLIGSLVFGGGGELLAYSQVEAVLLALFVLYIIWMALLLYRVVEAAGAIRAIGQGIARLTTDSVLQLLILAWVFSAFLQGVAGFGVPVAVVAPLLIGLGFDPVLAVAGTAIGHSWSVTFGDIASSFNALIAATGLPGSELAPWSGVLLGVACFGCGLTVAYAYGRWQTLRRGLPAILLIGGSMVLTQYLLAVNGLWNLAGFVAGMVGLAVGAAVTRLPLYRNRTLMTERVAPLGHEGSPTMSLWLATLPYLVLILVVAAAELWGPLHRFLNQVMITASFPEVSTGLGWVTLARVGKRISVFGHAGALLAYTAVLTYVVYRAKGCLKRGELRGIVLGTVRSATSSSIGILSMVGMAMIMARCGMTYTLASGISSTVGRLFPLASPFIGLLGAFMTGSNTNSNVIFAPLQQSTAEMLGIAASIILGAQTTGGALGSMLAPAKVIVGCSTAGLGGQEGKVMRVTVPYGLLIAAVIGVVTWLFIVLEAS